MDPSTNGDGTPPINTTPPINDNPPPPVENTTGNHVDPNQDPNRQPSWRSKKLPSIRLSESVPLNTAAFQENPPSVVMPNVPTSANTLPQSDVGTGPMTALFSQSMPLQSSPGVPGASGSTPMTGSFPFSGLGSATQRMYRQYSVPVNQQPAPNVYPNGEPLSAAEAEALRRLAFNELTFAIPVTVNTPSFYSGNMPSGYTPTPGGIASNGQVSQSQLPQVPRVSNGQAPQSQVPQSQVPQVPRVPNGQAPQSQVLQSQVPQVPQVPQVSHTQVRQSHVPQVPQSHVPSQVLNTQVQVPHVPQPSNTNYIPYEGFNSQDLSSAMPINPNDMNSSQSQPYDHQMNFHQRLSSHDIQDIQPSQEEFTHPMNSRTPAPFVSNGTQVGYANQLPIPPMPSLQTPGFTNFPAPYESQFFPDGSLTTPRPQIPYSFMPTPIEPHHQQVPMAMNQMNQAAYQSYLGSYPPPVQAQTPYPPVQAQAQAQVSYAPPPAQVQAQAQVQTSYPPPAVASVQAQASYAPPPAPPVQAQAQEQAQEQAQPNQQVVDSAQSQYPNYTNGQFPGHIAIPNAFSETYFTPRAYQQFSVPSTYNYEPIVLENQPQPPVYTADQAHVDQPFQIPNYNQNTVLYNDISDNDSDSDGVPDESRAERRAIREIRKRQTRTRRRRGRNGGIKSVLAVAPEIDEPEMVPLKNNFKFMIYGNPLDYESQNADFTNPDFVFRQRNGKVANIQNEDLQEYGQAEISDISESPAELGNNGYKPTDEFVQTYLNRSGHICGHNMDTSILRVNNGVEYMVNGIHLLRKIKLIKSLRMSASLLGPLKMYKKDRKFRGGFISMRDIEMEYSPMTRILCSNTIFRKCAIRYRNTVHRMRKIKAFFNEMRQNQSVMSINNVLTLENYTNTSVLCPFRNCESSIIGIPQGVALIDHIAVEHYRKNVNVCDVCHKTFSRPDAVLRHKVTSRHRAEDDPDYPEGYDPKGNGRAYLFQGAKTYKMLLNESEITNVMKLRVKNLPDVVINENALHSADAPAIPKEYDIRMVETI